MFKEKQILFPSKKEAQTGQPSLSTEQLVRELSTEDKRLNHGLARQLKEPVDGSYLGSLKRLAAGFVFAGITLGQVSDLVAPTIAKEKLIADSLTEGDVNGSRRNQQTRKKLKIVLEAFEMRGGVKESDQLDLVGRPTHLGKAVFRHMRDVDTPYYIRPDVILGEKFISQNPVEAEDYYEKILRTIRSTVEVRSDGGTGSGAIINTAHGKMILTNEHVVDGGGDIQIEFAGQKIFGNAEIVARSVRSDLALLKITKIEKIVKRGEDNYWSKPIEKQNFDDIFKEYEVESLDIQSDDDFDKVNKTHTLASVGCASDYPFSAMITHGDYLSAEGEMESAPNIDKAKKKAADELLYTVPDERFSNRVVAGNVPHMNLLGAKKHNYGRLDAMLSRPGVSGGPTTIIDSGAEAMLVGLNVVSSENKDEQKESGFRKGYYNGLVTAKNINKFLEKFGYKAGDIKK